jgi:hypothetical protein
MELSRRRVIVAAAGGLAAGTALWSLQHQSAAVQSGDESGLEVDQGVLMAVAEVVYPTEVDTDTAGDLIRSYLRYQPPRRRERIGAASRALDRQARRQYGTSFSRLSTEERETLLRELGVDRVAPDPDGTVPERIRYHLVNGALYALFTDPTGGRLVSIENPRGHPGGYESYAGDPVVGQ